MNNIMAPLDAPVRHEACFIDGAWVKGDGPVREVRNPADGALLGVVPDLDDERVGRAIEAAANAFPKWRRLLARERGRILCRWAQFMRDDLESLARLMTLEQGKPLAESRQEIEYAASFLEWFGEEACRLYGDIIPSHLPNTRAYVTREPVGVTAAITPWNFPSAMITRKAGAALAAGCTIIVRPALETPFSALALAELAARAGVPPGVFNVVTGDGPRLARLLLKSPIVRKISFTGSTEVGRILLKQAADNVMRASMELGGHAPFIVFDDCDTDRAIQGCVDAKFVTSGQDCLAANRIYVQRSIYDEFCTKLAAQARALKVGNGLDDGVQIGPLIGPSAVQRCEQHIRDAEMQGARLLCGGARHRLGGNFFQPTVLSDVTETMRVAREETFGPVAAILPFDDEGEVLARSNDTTYGLAAYVYSDDIRRIHRMTDGLEFGMVAVNTPRFTGAPIPFGGRKQSGLGREGSRYGLDDYTELKYVCLGDLEAASRRTHDGQHRKSRGH